MKKKTLKSVLLITGIVAVSAAVVIISAYSVLNYYIIPRMTGVKLSDMGIGITDVVNTITDKQVIDNIVNFDKQSAGEIMKALTELDTETKESGGGAGEADVEDPANAPYDTDKKHDSNEKHDAPNNNEPTKEDKKKNTDTSKPIDTKGAYQRIMDEASKDEIAQGMAIISKVDMGKVNELRKNGNNSEVKAYIKSVLTPGEISTAVTLYNKYKHLL